MEMFFIELNELSHKKSRLIRFWLGGAIILIVLLLLSILFIENAFTRLEILLPIVAYFAVYIYFTYKSYYSQMYISSDNYALEYKFGMLSKQVKTIIWDTITKVKFGPTYVAFFKRSGKKNTISLGWLPYAKLKEIKEKICEVANEKGIPCEWAEYKRF